MIPKECKRLAEVDFPIAVVSKHSAREKSIRHGHPSTLHLWWARRPLAACRAMLLALLLPDPCEPLCPLAFKERARELLPKVQGNTGSEDIDLREALLKFIGDFSNWDLSSNQTYLEVGRGLVKAAHPEEAPLVVDPFAGGGSIPLEALRLGCEAFASDLNPVACLILKVMLEDIPRWGRKKIKVKRQNGEEIEADGLAEALRIVGKEIKEQAEKELAEYYPKDPDGATPIAYLWARTVRCESPNCGAEIPLMRSFWLCKKANRKWALRYEVKNRKGNPSSVEFEVFEPKNDKEVPGGTVSRAKATCLCCGAVLPPERVRAQLTAQRGGADVIFDAKGLRAGGARILAVVKLKTGDIGRHYSLPTERDYTAAYKAQKHLKAILDQWEGSGRNGLCPVPDEPTPAGGGSGAGRAFSVQKYGMLKWGEIFTARQKAALLNLGQLTGKDIAPPSVFQSITLSISRCSEQMSSLVRWRTTVEAVAGTFGRNALPMMWDFTEIVPAGEGGSNFSAAVEWVAEVIEKQVTHSQYSGQIELADATESPMPGESVGVWFTDPPYYDAIPYADLSDFFFVWMRRLLPGHSLLSDPFNPSNCLTPKSREAVQDETKRHDGKPRDRMWFEQTMAVAFAEGRRVLREDGVASVVFAHKTTEGWEALLSGMIKGGWTITGSWPIATERPGRLRSQESAALATSVHLVCRPRPEDAPAGDWAEVLRELPNRVGGWMERLQGEGVRGADLVFACIGPALEIFSRYSRVETADGKEVKLAEYLVKVWEVVGRTALEQVLGTEDALARNGAAGALEEDARLTALFLWTLQSTNGNGGSRKPQEQSEEETDEDEEEEEKPKGRPRGFSLVFDVVRRFAQPLGINLPVWEGRIIETKKGVVRLLSVGERADQLFGKEGARSVAYQLESEPKTQPQLLLFQRSEDVAPKVRGRGHRRVREGGQAPEMSTSHEATTLDRVHAAMLLQAGGMSNALRALIKSELDRGPDFLRLANALSALYPRGSEEKRLLDAMLLAVPK